MNEMGDLRPIGIFDSGMGGLTVMRALIAKLPQESFVYLGDTARLPYGTKSADTVTRYAVQAARALTARGVKLVVVACNTASAAALPALQAALRPTPVLGVIEPGAEAAVRVADAGPIAVIATEGTVRGGAYVRAIRALAPAIPVVQQACPLFVPLAEEGILEGTIAELAAERYLAPLFEKNGPRVLVLGCTHFPVLAPIIAHVARRYSRHIVLVDSAQTTAESVAHLLGSQGLANGSPSAPQHIFLATDGPERFARLGEIFLGRKPDPVELIDLQ
ncbi:MAG TPA: glutamate racemase [Rhizomicrobium sp.]|nr:glutamate racemase [Rhizomicrobium sp.]